ARPVGSLTIQRTMYKILGFRTVVASARASDYAGGQGGTVAFKGTIRKPIVSTPSISLKSALHYRHIKSDAVNPVYYTPGNHSVMDLGATYEHRPTPFIRYSAGGGLMVGLGDRSFSRFHLMANVSWRYQRKLTLQLRSWLGGFVTGGDIPAHYKIWMSGGVDPNFENNFALNRTDDGGKGPVNIYDDQFISRGPALRGLLDKASTATAWGVNVDHSLPFVPVALFADMAGAADLRDTFVDGGLKLSLGAIVLYLPLYESWEPQNVASSFTWITSRARFELALPSIRIGR
ncbi:MAG: hypothetical protein ACE5GH_06875, partial [Fidelibacterota bacterium]